MKKSVNKVLSYMVLFALLISIGTSVEAKKTAESKEETVTEITLEAGSKDYADVNYKDVEKKFKNAGFSAVSCLAVKSLKYSEADKNEKVSKVTIDGKAVFTKGQKVKSNAKIVISYKCFDTAKMPFSANELDSYYFETIRECLEYSGFTNVKVEKVFDYEDTEKEFHNEILVDGESNKFFRNIDIPKDTPILVRAHFAIYDNDAEINILPEDKSMKIGLFVDGEDKGVIKTNTSAILKSGEHVLGLYDYNHISDVSANEESIFIENDCKIDCKVSSADDGSLNIETECKRVIKAKKKGYATISTLPLELTYREDVETVLKDMGFSKVEVDPIYDVYDWTKPNKKINRVEIDSRKDYKYGDEFKSNTKVKLTIHKRAEENPNRVVMEYGADEFCGMPIKEARKILKDAGFTDIEENLTMVNDPNTEGVSNITISSSPFKKGTAKYKNNKVHIDYNVAYTYDSIEKTMYTKDTTKIYSFPVAEADYNAKSLPKDFPVEVTGKCKETGLYRIVANGTTWYMDSKALTSDKPKKEPSIADYTFTKMSGTKYAKSGMNVRSLPDTIGEKVGYLDQNDSVNITGKCNETGWYRFDYNGKEAYGNNDYLLDNKVTIPEKTTPVVVAPGTNEPVSGGDEIVSFVVNINKSRMKYHKPTCRSVDTIKPENRVDFSGSWADFCSLYKNYSPCGNCHPRAIPN